MPGTLKVTVASGVTDLTTLDAARLEVDQNDTDADNLLRRLVARASAVVAKYCRPLLLETLEETFRVPLTMPPWLLGLSGRGYGCGFGRLAQPQTTLPLVLSRVPIVAVDAITENGVTLDPAADFELDAGSGLVWRLRSGIRSRWCGPVIVVDYAAGYASVPADVEGVVLSLVRSAFFASGRDPNVAMDTLNGDRMQYWDRSVNSMALDAGMTAQLADYRPRRW